MNLATTIRIQSGGPGSGCQGPNCGRPEGSGSKYTLSRYAAKRFAEMGEVHDELVHYSGNKSAILQNGFSENAPSAQGEEEGGLYGRGVYFFKSAEVSGEMDRQLRDFGEPLHAYAKLERPFVLDTDRVPFGQFMKKLSDWADEWNIPLRNRRSLSGDEITDVLRTKGYDGVVAKSKGGTEVNVFDPRNIRIVRE